MHRAVGVDQEEGGGRRGGEGDRGRSDWCENEGYVGADVVLGVVYFYVKSTLLMVLMTLVMTTTLTRARSRMAMKECWNFLRLVSRWILSFFPDKDFSHLVLLQILPDKGFPHLVGPGIWSFLSNIGFLLLSVLQTLKFLPDTDFHKPSSLEGMPLRMLSHSQGDQALVG